MNKENLQVGDIVYAKTSTMGRYIITNYVRGFIGIVVKTGRIGRHEDLLVLDLFASNRNPLVFELDDLFQPDNPNSASNIDFFRHALSNSTVPYDKPVPDSFIATLHAFDVNSEHFSKMNHVPFAKWKEHVSTCTALSRIAHKNHYERNKLDPSDLNERLDVLQDVFSRYFFTMTPIIQPKLSL